MKAQRSLRSFLITTGCIAVILIVFSEIVSAKPAKPKNLKNSDKKALTGGDKTALKGGDKKALKGGDKKALKGGDKKALKDRDSKKLKQHDDSGYPEINSLSTRHYKCFNEKCKHPPPPEPIVKPFTPTVLEKEISKNRKEFENSPVSEKSVKSPGSEKHADRVKSSGSKKNAERLKSSGPEKDAERVKSSGTEMDVKMVKSPESKSKKDNGTSVRDRRQSLASPDCDDDKQALGKKKKRVGKC